MYHAPQTLGMPSWSVEGRKVAIGSSISHSAKRVLLENKMEVSQFIEFANLSDPFGNILADSVTLDFESSSGRTIALDEDFDMVATDSGSQCKEMPQSTESLLPYDLVGVRLSLVGLGLPGRESLSSSQSSKSSTDELRDELHSHLYSSVLETVRVQLIECVPQITDEMISRAIISAFANDSSKWKNVKSGDDSPKDVHHAEVDYLWTAVQLRNSRGWNKASIERSPVYLQQLLDDIFLLIRREVFTCADHVLRAVLSFLSILEIETDNVYLPRDTIIMEGLPGSITRQGLLTMLTKYGEISALAIACSQQNFAYCRFRHESDALRAMTDQRSWFSVAEGVDLNLTIIQEESYQQARFERITAETTSHGPFAPTASKLVSPTCVSKHISEAYWKDDKHTVSYEPKVLQGRR